MITFQQASFVKSAAKIDDCPPDEGAEVAFCGRSNAGKSSAINVITGQGKLARTSKTPGRTQLINFFSLDDTFRLVDLPGYGYARVPIPVKEHWHKHLDVYLRQRHCLKGLILLMDIRHPLKEFDLTMIDWSSSSGMPLHILLTKADKFKRGAQQAALMQTQKQLPHQVTIQIFSATKRMGLETVQDKLRELLTANDEDEGPVGAEE